MQEPNAGSFSVSNYHSQQLEIMYASGEQCSNKLTDS